MDSHSSLQSMIRKCAKLLLFEQTLFALPFAYLGVLFADGAGPAKWILVTIAVIAARTAGMSFNRVLDAGIDARNPRTRDRLIPRGEIARRDVWLIGILSSLVLVGCSFLLNRLCFYLSFPAVGLLFSYSLFKRFTATSHFYLGLVEAAAPVGGYIAVTGKFALVPILLGTAIMMWIAGLDIVYAIQDREFDASHGLFSIPVRFGRERALLISSISYALSIAALAGAGIVASRQVPYWISVICVAIIFFKQQTLARSEDIKSATRDFFHINSFISPILFLGTLMDILVTF